MGTKTLRPRKIESIGEWEILKKALIMEGYTAFQYQYSAEQAEGFHAWFIAKSKSVEVITHNPEVQEGMVKYNSM